MKNRKLLLLLLIPIFLAILFFIPHRDTHADFGDFSGSSDYGGSSSSSSSSSSSDYSSSSSRSSRSSSSTSYSSSSSSNSSTIEQIISSLFALTFYGLIIFAIVKLVSHTSSKPNLNYIPPQSTPLKPILDYKSIDPDFDENEFKEKISNLYVQFQNAWTNKNLESLRPYLTDTAFGQYDRQLNHYREEGRTNKVDKIAVLSVDIKGWSQDNGKDQIVASVKTRIVDYVISDKTGKIVEGSDKVEKFMEYEWSLLRTTGVKTITKEGTTEQRCPNCGGALNINQTAKCPYCRRIVTTDKFNWLVNQIKGISQRTGK